MFKEFGTHQNLWVSLYIDLIAIINLYPKYKEKPTDLDPSWVGDPMIWNTTLPHGDLSHNIDSLIYIMLQYPKPPTRATKPLDYILEPDPSNEEKYFNASIEVLMNIVPNYNGELSCYM